MKTALTHIALHVNDLEASRTFYQDFAGMSDVSPLDEQSSPWFSSKGDETTIAIVLVDGADEQNYRPTNTTRLGFSVKDKDVLKDLYAKAANDNKIVQAYEESADGQRASFRMTDPNGFLVEFWTSETTADQTRFQNMTLHVKDMEKTRAFYEDWGGMEFHAYGKTAKSLRLVSPDQDNPVQLIICDSAIEGALQNEDDITHIGIAVDSIETLRDIYNRAKDAGLVDIDWLEMPEPAGTLFMIRDPDGNLIEFSYGQPLGEFGQGYDKGQDTWNTQHRPN